MESRSQKVAQFLIENSGKINILLTLVYFGMAILNGYTAIDSYQAGAYKVAVWNAFSAGMFASTGVFFTTFIYQLITSRRAWKMNSELLMENFELKHELLILKMPNIDNKAKL